MKHSQLAAPSYKPFRDGRAVSKMNSQSPSSSWKQLAFRYYAIPVLSNVGEWKEFQTFCIRRLRFKFQFCHLTAKRKILNFLTYKRNIKEPVLSTERGCFEGKTKCKTN